LGAVKISRLIVWLSAVVMLVWACQKAVQEELHITGSPLASPVSPVEVVISWETDLPGDSRVLYGITPALGERAMDTEERQFHQVTLSGLQPGTRYYFRVKSVSSTFSTEDSSAIDSFLTEEATLRIVIGPDIDTTAGVWQVVWQTDSLSDSRVDYGTDYQLGESLYDSSLVYLHTMVLPELSANTWYYFRVTSTSQFGATVTSSLDSFRTSAAAAAVSFVLGPEVSEVADNFVYIVWSTNIATTGRVDWGLDSSLGSSVSDTSLTLDHVIELSDLIPGEVYYYRVTATAPSGESISSALDTFSVGSKAELTFVMLPSPISLAPNQELISWSTNIATWGRVRYGLDNSLQYQVEDTTITFSHDVVLDNLYGGNTYYYQVEAISEAGDTIFSEIDSFVTATGSLSIVSGPDIMIVGQDYFMVAWETDQPADATIEYGLTDSLGSTVSDTTFDVYHSIVVNNLQTDSLYYFRVRSFSIQMGAEAISSIDTVRISP